jgi:hypothetical protein
MQIRRRHLWGRLAADCGGSGPFPLRSVGASLERRISPPYAEYDAVTVRVRTTHASLGGLVRALLLHESLQQARVEGQMAVLQLDRTYLDQAVEM